MHRNIWQDFHPWQQYWNDNCTSKCRHIRRQYIGTNKETHHTQLNKAYDANKQSVICDGSSFLSWLEMGNIFNGINLTQGYISIWFFRNRKGPWWPFSSHNGKVGGENVLLECFVFVAFLRLLHILYCFENMSYWIRIIISKQLSDYQLIFFLIYIYVWACVHVSFLYTIRATIYDINCRISYTQLVCPVSISIFIHIYSHCQMSGFFALFMVAKNSNIFKFCM